MHCCTSGISYVSTGIKDGHGMHLLYHPFEVLATVPDLLPQASRKDKKTSTQVLYVSLL
jgi:hypothetical protein